MRLLAGNRLPGTACALLAVCAIALAGCGGSVPPHALKPGNLVLTPNDLPSGFTVAAFSVPQLVAGNRAAIEDARTAQFAPDFCRPTADAALNEALRTDNSAIVAARRLSTALVELVTTARRDVAADLFAMSAECARTETTITRGNLAGTRIVAEYTELPMPQSLGELRSDERVVIVRSAVTTTMRDGAVRTQIGYAGYAWLDRENAVPVTIQLTVSGQASPATRPATPAQAPMTDEQFVDLYGTALKRVTDPDR